MYTNINYINIETVRSVRIRFVCFIHYFERISLYIVPFGTNTPLHAALLKSKHRPHTQGKNESVGLVGSVGQK